MAFADLMLGAVSLPIYIYFIGTDYQLWTRTISLPLSYFFGIVDTVSMKATIISAVAISVKRFYAICWPFKHRTLPIRAYRIAIFIMWTLAVLFTVAWIALSLLTSYRYAFYVGAVFNFIPTVVICGCNIGILREFQKGSVALQQQNRASQNRKLTKTLLLVCVLVLMSWLPFIILNFLTALDIAITGRYLLIASILNYSSSFVNPVVYALRILEFRQALALCCFRRQAVITIDHIESRNNAAVAVSTATQLRTLRADPSHVQLAYEQEAMDTKL